MTMVVYKLNHLYQNNQHLKNENGSIKGFKKNFNFYYFIGQIFIPV